MLLESGVRGLEELLESGGVFVELVQALDGDAECRAGFVEGGHGSLNAVELSFESGRHRDLSWRPGGRAFRWEDRTGRGGLAWAWCSP